VKMIDCNNLLIQNSNQQLFLFMTLNMIDKYVRENDENWTSKQSAACVKSGDGISTFRDKYGE